MQPVSALRNTSYEEPVHTHGPKVERARALKEDRSSRFGLPCANCKAYYDSDLPACPICECSERVPAEEATVKLGHRLKKQSADTLQGVVNSFLNFDPAPACVPPMQLALHCDKEGERFLLESKLLICAQPAEIDAGDTSLCILDENHDTPKTPSICLNCYKQLREKLNRAETALLIDLGEATRIVYQAVWADPSPADPSRTYQNAAQALLNELCRLAGIVRLPDAM